MELAAKTGQGSSLVWTGFMNKAPRQSASVSTCETMAKRATRAPRLPPALACCHSLLPVYKASMTRPLLSRNGRP